MHSRHWMLRLSCGLMLLTLGGCYSTSPFGQPYGPGGNPGYYSPPQGGFGQPGPTLAPPQNGVDLGAPETFAPDSVRGEQWRQSQRAGSIDSDDPLYHSRDDQDHLVPDPIDPDNGFNDSTFEGAERPFGASRDSGEELNSIGTVAAIEDENEMFQPPLPIKPTTAIRQLGDADITTDLPPADLYNYDREAYAWLRGTVDYDSDDGTWNIIYSLQPERTDEFGGSITLVGEPQLKDLNPNDRVVVQGRIDYKHLDHFGKPQYRIEKLAHVVPEHHH